MNRVFFAMLLKKFEQCENNKSYLSRTIREGKSSEPTDSLIQ